MKTYVRYWYWIDLIFAGAAAIVLVAQWGHMETLQRLLVMNFIALAIHQAEEYGWPGGEPMVMNYALMQSDLPDRFPLNQLSAMATNVVALVLVYLLPCFFPHLIWFGLAGMLFGLGQVIVHGVITNLRMKSLYNPGLAAVMLLHLPIGVSYLAHIVNTGAALPVDWVGGVALAVATAAFLVGWPTYALMASRNTAWPFSEAELARFNVREKCTAKGIAAPEGNEQGLYYKTPLAKVQRMLHPRG